MSGESPELTFCLIVVVKSWSAVYWTSMPLAFSNSASEALKFFSSSPPKAPRIVTFLSPSAEPPSTTAAGTAGTAARRRRWGSGGSP